MTPAPGDKREELSLQALTKEISDTDAAMRELLLSADKAIAGVGTLLVATLTLVLTKQVPVVLIALPYALTATFFFMLQKFTDRQIQAGTRRGLEEVANQRLGHCVFTRSTVARSIPRPDERTASWIYGLAALAVVIASTWELAVYDFPGGWIRWPLHVVGLGMCGVAVAIPLTRMASAEEVAYQLVKSAALPSPAAP